MAADGATTYELGGTGEGAPSGSVVEHTNRLAAEQGLKVLPAIMLDDGRDVVNHPPPKAKDT